MRPRKTMRPKLGAGEHPWHPLFQRSFPASRATEPVMQLIPEVLLCRNGCDMLRMSIASVARLAIVTVNVENTISRNLRSTGGLRKLAHCHTYTQLLGRAENPIAFSRSRSVSPYASSGVMTVHTRDGTWVVPTHRAVCGYLKPFRTRISMSGTVAMRTLYLRSEIGNVWCSGPAA